MFDLLDKILGPIKTYFFGVIVGAIAFVSIMMLWKLKALEYHISKLEQENDNLKVQLRLHQDQCKTKLFELKEKAKKAVIEERLKQIDMTPVISVKSDTESKKQNETNQTKVDEGTTNDKSETIPDKPGNYTITIH